MKSTQRALLSLDKIVAPILCLALMASVATVLPGCSGSASSSGGSGSDGAALESTSANSDSVGAAPASANSDSASAAPASADTSSASASTLNASAGDEHNSYFVGKWDLYESEEYTHDQVVQVMEQYANDEETRTKMNEAYGRDNVEFCARFAADGTGEIDTGAELIPFTWEATNEGAVTFTSFNGKETAIHLPITDGKFTLNGDTYAKAS